MAKISIDDIRAAAQRIAPYVHRTPVMSSAALNRIANAEIFFKCENLQKAGAFKIRGATNAVFALEQAAADRGVATHSSGNHAAALALAAHNRGIPATVVMPDNAVPVKRAAVTHYGASIVLCEPTLAAREATLASVVEFSRATVIHPYNDERVIAGQATVALELCAEIDSLDCVIAPVGGGGLLSGTALSVRACSPRTRVFGAEPDCCDDARQSFHSGRLLPATGNRSIADGLLTSLGDKTFAIIREQVEDILTVSEQEIVSAMRLIWERMKLVVEPSAAVPLAVLLKHSRRFAGQRVGIVLSGGNVDVESVPWRNA
jgi:threonine dehydratase